MEEEKLWQVRAFVYRHFGETGRPPSVDETSMRLGLSPEEAAAMYQELHQRHAIFLEPGAHHVRMAFPFSGVETAFRVHATGRTYFANCAWDVLGIPVALHADAEMEAVCAQSGETIRLRVRDQQIEGSDALVHFLIPFREWYNDLPFT
jgi:hypothetical protein